MPKEFVRLSNILEFPVTGLNSSDTCIPYKMSVDIGPLHWNSAHLFVPKNEIIHEAIDIILGVDIFSDVDVTLMYRTRKVGFEYNEYKDLKDIYLSRLLSVIRLKE